MSDIPKIILDNLKLIEPGAEFVGRLPAIRSSGGQKYYAKIGTPMETEQYIGEAESLEAINTAAPRLAPRVLSFGVYDTQRPYFISQYKDLRSLSNSQEAITKLAHRLATELHVYKSNKGFGFQVPTHCGATRLQNGWYDRWDQCFSAMIEGLLNQLGSRHARLRKSGGEIIQRQVEHQERE